MLFEVGEFCQRVEGDLAGLIDELQELTGRSGDQERAAWGRSLPKLSIVLAKPELKDFHLSLNNSGAVALEYRLPASSSWCDVVLLGEGSDKPAAVILELKDWDLSGDRPGPSESLIAHQRRLVLHPSDQVRGYVEYCRRFHSAVHEFQALVDGCVFFTGRSPADEYRRPPHDRLSSSFPLFTFADEDVSQQFVPYLCERLKRPHPSFAAAFDRGTYQQDRNFVRQVARVIRGESESPFVLLDEQRLGYEFCIAEIDRLLNTDYRGKLVIVIEGPPGSGKSVLAANLWANLVLDARIDGNVVLTTTSSCQKSNWMEMFRAVAKARAGRGLVVPANQYNPGLTNRWIDRQRKKGHTVGVSDWRANLALYLESGPNRAPDDNFAVSIVDEAHALIDPTAPGAEGVQNSGWCMQAGPQAWHIIRASRVSVFLMDTEQSYRDNETTRRAQIECWAEEHGVGPVATISLADAQFRCGGSKEYIDWMESMLGLTEHAATDLSWRKGGVRGAGRFQFEIVDYPEDLDQRLRHRLAEGGSARVVSSYARKWVTKRDNDPHDLPEDKRDFLISYVRDGRTFRWSRIWNYAPDENYAMFIQAPRGSRMHDDPLCEVGCPYVIRGFDYDYLGVLWLSDLVWRGDRWVADTDHIHEIALRKTVATAKRSGPTSEARDVLLRKVQRGYRILLSRAIRGLYVWFEDEETRAHVEGLLRG
jgi:DUF2075 family protein